jgi:hypothetical protein
MSVIDLAENVRMVLSHITLDIELDAELQPTFRVELHAFLKTGEHEWRCHREVERGCQTKMEARARSLAAELELEVIDMTKEMQ